MKTFMIGTAVLVGLISCNSTAPIKKTEEVAAGTPGALTADTLVILDSLNAPDSSEAILPATSVLTEQISAQMLPVIKLRKTITNDNQSIHLTLIDVAPGVLRISLEPDRPDANIRISQVLMPDGATDGPFGQQLNYEAPQQGDYTFIISKSNMASGSPVGDVYITIEK